MPDDEQTKRLRSAMVEVEGTQLRTNSNFTRSVLMGIDSYGYAWADTNLTLLSWPRTRLSFAIHQKEQINYSLLFHIKFRWATS